MDSNVNVSSELFTDLDPLGTGRSRPYVDKKDFFSELKSSSPKLGNMSNSAESPVPMTLSSSMEATTNVGLTDPVSLSSCPVSSQQTSSSTSFVHNINQRSSLRGSGNQPIPPPRSGSELTYGHLESSRRSFTSSDTMPRHVRGFGFSSHLSQPSTSSSSSASCVVTSSVLSTSSMSMSRNTNNNPAATITSLASSWRSQPSGSHLQDTRLYHTLGRPMTTFNRCQMEMEEERRCQRLGL